MSSLMDWAKKEVEIVCSGVEKDDEYGIQCYKSALKAFQSLVEDGHSGMSIGFTQQILNRLINGQPLTAIEDVPDSWELAFKDENGREVHQCTRMSSLFKRFDENGMPRYSDHNRFVAHEVGSSVCFHSSLINTIAEEMFPIEFPYIPYDKPYIFTVREFLSDPKNGDFDTVHIVSVETPNGYSIKLDRYFGEVDGEWKELKKDEFHERAGFMRYFI